jgi:hypothetical protein
LSRAAAALLASAAVLAPACGGSEQAAPPDPILPRALAESLAAQSEVVAARLDAGDSCGAAEEATSLQATALAAIEDGEIPPAFADELEATVTELAGEIRCEEEDEEGRGKGNGKGNGKNGKNGKGGDD